MHYRANIAPSSAKLMHSRLPKFLLFPPKMLLEDLWPMITNNILSIPSVRYIALNELSRPKIDLSGVIKIFLIYWTQWSMIYKDQLSVCIRWLLMSGAIFILRWSCFISFVITLFSLFWNLAYWMRIDNNFFELMPYMSKLWPCVSCFLERGWQVKSSRNIFMR